MGTSSIIIPISKNTWESEATLFSDFSSFLPLRVSSHKDIYSKRHPELILWDFYKTKFTLGNLISRSKSSLIDRSFAELIFPNATFISKYDRTCYCCKLSFTLSYDSSIGAIEYFSTSDEIRPNYLEVPQLKMNETDYSILLITSKDEYTFLSCGDPSYDPPLFLTIPLKREKMSKIISSFVFTFHKNMLGFHIYDDFRLAVGSVPHRKRFRLEKSFKRFRCLVYWMGNDTGTISPSSDEL